MKTTLPSSTPTKPIGSFYDKVAADRIMAQRGCTMVEDAGRGWRQVVPLPQARGCHREEYRPGAGGQRHRGHHRRRRRYPRGAPQRPLVGTPAVIDKDFASAKLAELLNADMLIILTAVEKVAHQLRQARPAVAQ